MIKSVVEAEDTTLERLNLYRIVEKTSAIIEKMLYDKQDWCLDVLCGTMHSIICKIWEGVQMQHYADPSVLQAIDSVAGTFDFLVELHDQKFEASIVEKASASLHTLI